MVTDYNYTSGFSGWKTTERRHWHTENPTPNSAVEKWQHVAGFRSLSTDRGLHKTPSPENFETGLENTMLDLILKKYIIPLCVAGFVTAFGGCQSPVDNVDAHLTQINTSVDNFRNQAILLNILRAEQSAPLSFVNLLSVPTQYNADISAALPSFEVGPLKIQSGRPFSFNNTSLGTTLQSQASPTLNNLTGKDFTQAATTGISALQLLRLVRDGYSMDLVLALTVSKVTLKYGGGYATFDAFPTRLIDCPNINDLSAREFILAAECLQRFRMRGAKLHVDFQAFDKLSATKETVAGQNSKSDKSTAEYNAAIDAELCFNIPRDLKHSELERLGAIESKGMKCSPVKRPGGVNWLSADFRSLVGIYRFLGEYLRRPDIQNFYLPISEEGFGTEDAQGEPLLTILQNYPGPCFVDVVYQGTSYCVPARGAYRTKAVFAILDQLQNNNTDTSKIPQPSVVTLSGQLR